MTDRSVGREERFGFEQRNGRLNRERLGSKQLTLYVSATHPTQQIPYGESSASEAFTGMQFPCQPLASSYFLGFILAGHFNSPTDKFHKYPFKIFEKLISFVKRGFTFLLSRF